MIRRKKRTTGKNPLDQAKSCMSRIKKGEGKTHMAKEELCENAVFRAHQGLDQLMSRSSITNTAKKELGELRTTMIQIRNDANNAEELRRKANGAITKINTLLRRNR